MQLQQLNIGDRFRTQGFNWELIVVRFEQFRNRTMVVFRQCNSTIGYYTLNGTREVKPL